MRVVTLPDGAQSTTVLPAGGGSPVFLGTAEVSSSGGPIVLNGGDFTGASTVVNPEGTQTVQTLAIDTTGLGIGAVMVWVSGCVALASSTVASCTVEFTVDGASLSPAAGNTLELSASGTVSYSFMAIAALSEGAHTLRVVCSTDANTTATTNPGAAFNSGLMLLFLAA